MPRPIIENLPVPASRMGRPSSYKPEHCDLLLEHMKKGNTFESFGSVVHVSLQTLYNWQDAHPDFLETRKLGMTYLRRFYEDLGRTIATGQLRRVVSEEAMLDPQGKPLLDGNGNAIMRRQYAPALPNAAVFIFMTKNMLGWKNDVNISFGEVPPGTTAAPTQVELMDKDKIKERMKQLVARAAQDDPELMEMLKNATQPK